MSPLAAPAAALAWLGGQGTRAIAAVVIVGLAVPPLGAVLKPYVPEAIFLLLSIAFVRVDPAVLVGHLRRPGLVLGATAWTMLAVPCLFGGVGLAIGLDVRAPDFMLGLMLQAVASPMMAAPAFAAVMGLDATLVLVALVASSILTPLTAPLFMSIFVGPALTLSPVGLGVTLLGILAGSAALGMLVRRVVGADAIARRRREIDGINILVVFVFVSAVMESVGPRLIVAPTAVLGLAALAFASSFGVLGLTFLVLLPAGHERAFALGMMASQRNMGLMLAATGGALPDTVWVWFALCQFPIYLAPQLLTPLTRRLVVRPA